MKSRPRRLRIGVFDSGLGGVTVLEALNRELSGVDFIYYGDTANVPYGAKSARQIRELSRVCAKKLLEKKVDIIVVACNTASAHALKAIKRVSKKIPVLGVIGPGIQSVMARLDSQTLSSAEEVTQVVIFATHATVKSQVYSKSLKEILGSQLTVAEVACPVLVPLIESGWVNDSIAQEIVRKYTEQVKEVFSQVSVSHLTRRFVLLGCTHYPWLERQFSEAMPGWEIINSADSVASTLKVWVLSRNQESLRQNGAKTNRVQWIFSDREVLPKSYIFSRILVELKESTIALFG